MIRLILLALCLASPAWAERFLVLQSTTSTNNSGLYRAILPQFEKASGIEVRVVAVGTGQALKNAANCDGDVVIAHDKGAETAFVTEGHGQARFDLMYNTFVLVGPTSDPAGVRGMALAAPALAQIARAQAPFASRGDDSGTHRAERELWRRAKTDPTQGSGAWYLETGAGMGATLNLAVAKAAYVLTDRATWLAFGNKQQHDILVQGDPALFNQYGLILVSPAACSGARLPDAQILADWLLGPDGQAAIAGFQVSGEQVFFPNAPHP